MIGLSTLGATAKQMLETPSVRCLFTTECVEDAACADAAFRMDLFVPGAPGGARLQTGLRAVTDFGDLSGYSLSRSPDVALHVFEGSGAHYVPSVGTDAARLSVHMEGPMVVSYLGICEAPE